jgi:hypothetical protein
LNSDALGKSEGKQELEKSTSILGFILSEKEEKEKAAAFHVELGDGYSSSDVVMRLALFISC